MSNKFCDLFFKKDILFRVGSVCSGDQGRIIQASIDCPSYFGSNTVSVSIGSDVTVPNCQYLYKEIDNCCPDRICDTQLDNLAKCELRNVTLVAGQKVYDPR